MPSSDWREQWKWGNPWNKCQEDAVKGLVSPALALPPRVRGKVMNTVLSKWDTRHSHLQTGHEVGGHLTVCEAGPGKTSSRECEPRDLWHLEDHNGESKSEQVEHPSYEKPKSQTFQNPKHFESQHNSSSEKKIHTLPWMWCFKPKIETLKMLHNITFRLCA